ncbi:uncharacterized protein EI97DRAFT_165672 [Westerdykella ornata]|uniref:Uncharacterized protein n=1 Tax=Westerdykella ornata TaxID=318751 RepID=A0A6A6J9K5_WESOR|nr:uncharacterized protein EI97DRAFT_165672 [Westerdykella ornata]KAF2273251.1 hypothetical protein EI97DRAFT_165672 [Westerdykella ornata]
MYASSAHELRVVGKYCHRHSHLHTDLVALTLFTLNHFFLKTPASQRPNEKKRSRQPEVVQYRRHCVLDYEQAQGAEDRLQKLE